MEAAKNKDKEYFVFEHRLANDSTKM